MTKQEDLDEVFRKQMARISHPMKRLFSDYAFQESRPLFIGILASLGAHALVLVPPFMLGKAVDAFFTKQSAFTLPFLPSAWIPSTIEGQFWFTVGIIGLSFGFQAVFHYFKGWGLNLFAQRVQHQIRRDTYDAMQHLEMQFFDNKETGELMSILNNDVNNLEQFLNGGLNVFTMLTLTTGSIGILLFFINWQLALVTLVTAPLVAVFTHLFVQRIQSLYSDVRASVGDLNSRLQNNLGGIKVIKAGNTEEFESERVEDASWNYFDTNWKAINLRIIFFPSMRIAMGISFTLTFLVGGLWVLHGQPPYFFSGTLTVGEFVTFIYLAQRFIWPMAQFGDFVNLYQEAHASAERIFGLMEEPKKIHENPEAEELEVEDARVEYEDVSFGYEDESVIRNIDFAVEPGEMCALVGPTGSGKSTVLKLLLRLYDPDEGRITVGGTDIRGVTPESLREHIGYVSQDTFLFSGTVIENIKYGAFEAEEDDVVQAAKAAQAHEFITDLPEGYETDIGEKGVKLSGGQRQRIGIARALLQDPEILILDEATSDVDTRTEKKIQEGMEHLIEDRTVLAIAHRLSTIRDADQIIVLEDGEIRERGNHEELLEEEGLYERLWAVQAGELEDFFVD